MYDYLKVKDSHKFYFCKGWSVRQEFMQNNIHSTVIQYCIKLLYKRFHTARCYIEKQSRLHLIQFNPQKISMWFFLFSAEVYNWLTFTRLWRVIMHNAGSRIKGGNCSVYSNAKGSKSVCIFQLGGTRPIFGQFTG